MPAYGGSLFDPARFPFLTATTEQGTLAVTVSDRVMLHVLRSVQIADIKGGARRISFRDIDVEQIGYIYEGLLGYTAAIASRGGRRHQGHHSERNLRSRWPSWKSLAAKHPDRKKFAELLRVWVEGDQPSAKPPSAAAIAKAVEAERRAQHRQRADPGGRRTTSNCATGIKPWLGLVRLDLRKRPFVVLDGGLLVKETPSRKNAGAHYTPKSLAEEVVLHALQPLCYSPGPHQTANQGSGSSSPPTRSST